MKRLLMVILCCFVNLMFLCAQQSSITLIVDGEGTTKEEAKNVALRSAIEQAYGVFVSSTTSILNDNLVEDEIITVSTGVIQSFEELNSRRLDNGKSYVSLTVTMSPYKLVSYVKNKGVTSVKCDVAGEAFVSTFKANKMIYDLYVSNVKKVGENYFQYLVSQKCDFFEYDLKIGEPSLNNTSNDIVDLPYDITIKSNGNASLVLQYADSLMAQLKQIDRRVEDLANTLNLSHYEGSEMASSIADITKRFMRHMSSNFSIWDNLGYEYLVSASVNCVKNTAGELELKDTGHSEGTFYIPMDTMEKISNFTILENSQVTKKPKRVYVPDDSEIEYWRVHYRDEEEERDGCVYVNDMGYVYRTFYDYRTAGYEEVVQNTKEHGYWCWRNVTKSGADVTGKRYYIIRAIIPLDNCSMLFSFRKVIVNSGWKRIVTDYFENGNREYLYIRCFSAVSGNFTFPITIYSVASNTKEEVKYDGLQLITDWENSNKKVPGCTYKKMSVRLTGIRK